jgi:hypothetical protein
LVLLFSTACSNTTVDQNAIQGLTGPQEIKGATEVLKFDPAAIAPGGQAVGGACDVSSIVPGAYRCILDGGNVAEPCLAASGPLLCGPDPVAGAVRALVNPTAPPPTLIPPSLDQLVPFFVELDGGRTCAIRTGAEPVLIGGAPALFDCDTPYTFILRFDKSTPTWRAVLASLDPATGQTPGGETPVNVLRAWVP